MKTALKILATLFATLTISCSSDLDDVNQDSISLSQKVVFLPQSTNFMNKLVTNYANNQRISEINYNGSGEVTQTREFTYGTGTSTASRFDPQHVFQGKTVYNYDSTNRISTIENYNSQNLLLGTRQFVYEGNDITVFYIENGVSTLIFLYKTNSSNLIYYEKSISSGLEQTLSYSGDTPTQLVASSGLQLGYEFFPTIMPTAIQSDAIEINNSALLSSIQQIKETSNYYLKKVNSAGGYLRYDKEFDANNYLIHNTTYSGTITPAEEQLTSETFYYYN